MDEGMTRLRNSDREGFMIILEEGFKFGRGKPIKVSVRLRVGRPFMGTTPRNGNFLYARIHDENNLVWYKIKNKKPVIYIRPKQTEIVTRIELDY